MLAIARGGQPPAEPQQSLAGDRRRGAVDRLVLVERIGRPREVVAEVRQAPERPVSQYGTPSVGVCSM